MTRGEAIRKFRRHWRRISKDTTLLAAKGDLKKKHLLSPSDRGIMNDCYLCEYAKGMCEEGALICDACPIDWGFWGLCNGGLSSSYFKWVDAKSVEERQSLALAISKLPRRKVKHG